MRRFAIVALCALSACSPLPDCSDAVYYVNGICVREPEIQRDELRRIWQATSDTWSTWTGDDCPSALDTMHWSRSHGVSLTWTSEDLTPAEDGVMRRYDTGVYEDVWIVVRPRIALTYRMWVLVHEYLHLLQYRCDGEGGHDSVVTSPTYDASVHNGSLDYVIVRELKE